MSAKSKNKRKPRVFSNPLHKGARATIDPMSSDHRTASWALGRIDRFCDWGWAEISLGDLWTELIPALKNFETMTWSSIKQATSHKSHNVSVEILIPEAQKRLEYLKLDDFGNLFSLRITQKKRVWGILQDGILRVIWYDPEHKVCPSLKD